MLPPFDCCSANKGTGKTVAKKVHIKKMIRMRRTNLEGSWKVDNKTTAQLVNLTEQISEVAANSCHDEH